MNRNLLLTFLATGYALSCAAFCPAIQAGEQSGLLPTELRIVAFGDSTTAVYDDWVPSNVEVYAQCLSRTLAERGIAVTVFNAGIGNTTTREGIARLDQDVRSHDPNLVIIQFGINDSWIDVDLGRTEPRLTREEFRNNLTAIISTLRQDGAAIILMTPNPMRWDDPFYIDAFTQQPGLLDTGQERGIDALLDIYAQDVREVAKTTGVMLVDVLAAFEDYGQQDGQSIDDLLLSGDGIHPNAQGQHLVCELLTGRIVTFFPHLVNRHTGNVRVYDVRDAVDVRNSLVID